MAGLEIVVGKRREQVVQGVVADGEREEQPGQKIAAREVARIEEVVFQREFFPFGLKVVIGQLPQLVQNEHAQAEGIEQRQAAPGSEAHEHDDQESRPPAESTSSSIDVIAQRSKPVSFRS